MKRILLTLLTVALVAALAVFGVVPVVVRQARLRDNARVVSGYRAATDALSPSECGAMLAQVAEHNRALDGSAWSDPYAPAAGEPATEGEPYGALLDPAGDGTMAILTLPKLGATLAVRHGGESGDGTARVAHAPLSRLPSRGTNGPCVVYAVPERCYDPFAGLDRLIAGDCFFLRVLQDTATYEVFQVASLSPQALTELRSAEGDDECALVAAAAAGSGDKRLVVRGRRVPRMSATPRDDSRALASGLPELIFAAPVAVAGLALLAIIEFFRRAFRRHRRRRMKL